ncbi:DUF2480 family protein [Faecalibacter rhinopitheci]|uniref:DUF2480 family protein n=1 Tax=Faecalibacter rhinopitheci TaxID=2779678 RepID=A0A8J7KDX5_9FLAO|nr:DUF2480 family protein [Faecalibacter rhinopitheci]MBF0597826.1 DUF2480 family protein [Faecalibacter rhinopitheci]
MSDEILNKVTNSGLITLDLEDYYPTGNRVIFDLKDWLYEELILKEKDFRQNLKDHDWSQYQGSYVAMTCTADAIVPSWAYLLVATYLQPVAKKVIHGSLKDLDQIIYTEVINNLNLEEYVDGKVIVKGCSQKPVPDSAYILLIEKLQPVVNSLMFGEACSTVPLYKKKKV